MNRVECRCRDLDFSTNMQQSHFPHNERAQGRFSPSWRKIGTLFFDGAPMIITWVTLATIVQGISKISQASAGPITYGTCVVGCEAVATVATGGPGVAFIIQCIQSCLPYLGPWCP